MKVGHQSPVKLPDDCHCQSKSDCNYKKALSDNEPKVLFLKYRPRILSTVNHAFMSLNFGVICYTTIITRIIFKLYVFSKFIDLVLIFKSTENQ